MYFKGIDNGYIRTVGQADDVPAGWECTEEEYNQILEAFKHKPPVTDSKDYFLKEDLTWEEIDVEPMEEQEEAEEILSILTGESE